MQGTTRDFGHHQATESKSSQIGQLGLHSNAGECLRMTMLKSEWLYGAKRMAQNIMWCALRDRA